MKESFDILVVLNYPKSFILKRILHGFREGKREGFAYGKMFSLIGLIFGLIVYSSSKDLDFAEVVRGKVENVFILRSDEDEREIFERLGNFKKSKAL